MFVICFVVHFFFSLSNMFFFIIVIIISFDHNGGEFNEGVVIVDSLLLQKIQ